MVLLHQDSDASIHDNVITTKGGGGGGAIGILVEAGGQLGETNNAFTIGPAGTGGVSSSSPGADGVAAEVKRL